MTSVSNSYDYSLGYYGTIALKLLVIYPPEVVCCIIHHIKEKEKEEAMNYHCKRSCLSMPYHLASDYSHFMKHDYKHRSVTEDIRILNEPFFWQLRCITGRGTMYIDGYTWSRPRTLWCRPVISKRLHKIDLYKKYNSEIRKLWYNKKKYPNRPYLYRVQFIAIEENIDNIHLADFDTVYERWELLP